MKLYDVLVRTSETSFDKFNVEAIDLSTAQRDAMTEAVKRGYDVDDVIDVVEVETLSAEEIETPENKSEVMKSDKGMKKIKHVIIDKDRYCRIIEAETIDDALRASDNLDEDADLIYCRSEYWGIYQTEITDEMIEESDCETAMSRGSECQCGKH